MACTVGDEELKWRYPLHGVAEAVPAVPPFRYRCKARTRLEDTLEIALPELRGTVDEFFTHEVEVCDLAGSARRAQDCAHVVVLRFSSRSCQRSTPR